MTNLSRLKVSLTKHGAHKAFVLLRDLDPNDVIKSVWNVHQGIKIERAQTKQNLSAFADESLPGIWRQAKDHSEATLKHLVFLAILFSHHEVIRAFQQAASNDGTGEIRRNVVLSAKAFTNTKNNIQELGLSTSFSEAAVTYDLRALFQNEFLGRLAHQLFSLKLQYAGWGVDGSVADEAVEQGFHTALSVGEATFRGWLEGGVAANVETVDLDAEQAAADADVSEIREFIFIKGHKPSKEGKSRRSIPREPREAKLTHNMLQTKLYEHLCAKYGRDSVGTEVPQGDRANGNSIDVVTSAEGETTFYELKTRASVRLCVREALPQLLEYAYWPDVRNSDKLVIVAEADVTTDAASYLKKLRDTFEIPIFYSKIDRETGALGELN